MKLRDLIGRIPGVPRAARAARALDARYREYRRGSLRVFIAGAPKTGNMWLKHLLSTAYDLPMVNLAGKPFPMGYPTQRRFITHEHLKPKPEVLAWAADLRVHFITMTRHPADIFLSLYHYMNTFVAQQGIVAASLCHSMIGQALDSPATFDYLRSGFRAECLDLTAQWMRSGRSLIIRYEDLHLDPEAVLLGLSGNLGALSPDQIRKSIDLCRFDSLKSVATGPMRMHYRQGRMGSWKTELPAAHLALMKQLYSEEIAFLGYSLDP
jgi:hypothetical protein